MYFRALLVAGILSMLSAAGAAAQSGQPQLPPQPNARPVWAPAGALLVSPCVAGMGSHWANPKDLPLGPIYGEYQGKAVFSEVMIDQKAFAQGKSWEQQLKPLPGYKIDHVDIDLVPYGHAGYPIPHYDIHAYYVPHEIHAKFCPNGERIRSAK
ncbi:MAG: hypothetical protein ACXWNK_11790 [Vulcanimicrobiaceae bacterium]